MIDKTMSLIVNRRIFWIILPGLLASCATLEKPQLSGDEVALTRDNITLLNGTYYRSSEDTTWCASAHNDLSRNLYLVSHKGNCVNLAAINDRRIRVTLLNGSDTTKSKVFKGRIKEGHFELRRRAKVIPALIFNYFWNSKTRLGVLASGDLTVDSRWIFFGHLTIFPAVDSERAYEAKHKRID